MDYRGPGPVPSIPASQLPRRLGQLPTGYVALVLAGLLASYTDILFALNRQTHPGEKRLVTALIDRCARLPDHMADDLADLLRTATTDLPGLPARVDRLLDRLDTLLRAEGFDTTDLPSLASRS